MSARGENGRRVRTASLLRLGRSLVLVSIDFLCLALAVTTAYFLWALPVREQAIGPYAALLPLLGLFIVGLAQAGLYPGFGLGPVEVLRRLSLVVCFGYLVLAAFSFALKLPHVYSRVTFGLAMAFSLLLLPAGRALVGYWVRGRDWFREPIVLIGLSPEDLSPEEGWLGSSAVGYRVVERLGPAEASSERLAELARQGIRVVVVRSGPEVEFSHLDQLQRLFRKVVVVGERHLQVQGLQVRSLGTVVGVEYTNHLLRRRNRIIKRVLDLGLGLVALLLAAPLILLLAFLVRLVSRGPALFVQRRIGLGGVEFVMPKIRTMRADAEQLLNESVEGEPDLEQEWTVNMKLRHDPRVIPGVGSFLRRFSLDELPQLWSVVKGDMSLVGPRPFPHYHVEQFDPAFRDLRGRVPPGVTGLWQVLVRSSGGLEEQQRLDTYYIRNWSIWLDLYILARTLGAVVSGRGAF